MSIMAEFQQEFLELYKKSDLNMPWNKLYRKALVGVFDTSLNLGEDLLFNLEYLSKCRRVAVLGEPLCWYVQDMGKTTLSSENVRTGWNWQNASAGRRKISMRRPGNPL